LRIHPQVPKKKKKEKKKEKRKEKRKEKEEKEEEEEEEKKEGERLKEEQEKVKVDLNGGRSFEEVFRTALDQHNVLRVQILLAINQTFINAPLFKYGNNPLHFAAKKGHNHLAELLLNQGADINAKNEGGNTSLHIAVHYKKEHIVKMLLEKGAKLNIQNTDRETPRQIAGAENMSELFKKKATSKNMFD